ncbi:MAG: hypothetical protein HUJ31_13990 [Pseudomonadales bacterium]|nr:hypothetical protein [Pseudomonadales bacterium]
MPLRVTARILTLFVCLAPAMAMGELYKYVNEDGVTVLDSHVPARYVKNGYTILSLDGRVLEVVPRALTEEEIRERDRRLAEEERQEREARERELADQNLLRLYSTPEDVIRARDSKLASIESYIETTETNLERLNEMKRSLEAELADIERAGGTIGQARLDRIKSVEKRIEQTEREIEEKRQEMEQTRESFAADLERVRQLYSVRRQSASTR